VHLCGMIASLKYTWPMADDSVIHVPSSPDGLHC